MLAQVRERVEVAKAGRDGAAEGVVGDAAVRGGWRREEEGGPLVFRGLIAGFCLQHEGVAR